MICFIIRKVKKIKANKNLQEDNNSKEQKIEELEHSQQIIDYVRDSMLKVENFKNFTDIEKEQFVENEVKCLCATIGVNMETINIPKIIQYFMEVANGINARGTESKKIKEE